MAKPKKKPDLPNPGPVSDDSLQLFLGYHLKRAFNIIRADLKSTLEPFELRMITYSALALIVDNPGLRQSQLADALEIERPNLVVVIDELEQRELIVRERVPTDRRAYGLQATLAGRRLCEKAMKADMAAEKKLMRNVSDEDRAVVIRVMQAITRGQAG